MKVYEVVCEGLVQRTITVEAANSAEASRAARQEFASLVGAYQDAVAIVDIYKQEK